MVLAISQLKGSEDGMDRTVVVAKDNTEYKKTEKELADKHKELSTLFSKVEVAKIEWEKTTGRHRRYDNTYKRGRQNKKSQ